MRHVIRTRTISGFLCVAGAAIGMGLTGPAMAQKTSGETKDYRTFHADGRIAYGKIGDSFTSGLVLYLAGNQFMVMEELVTDFLAKNQSVGTVYVQTIPPGQLLNQILKGGKILGQKTARNPDIYASVNLGHLKRLKAKGLMDEHMIYTHNKLELMVASGNPKGISGPKDLARADLVQSHPNPLTEGIFKFYGAEMLRDLRLHAKVTGNAKCKSCWAVKGKTWFTQRHHRETPDRIEKAKADVGIVWTTEIIEAKKHGRRIDGVAIPAPLNKSSKVGYAIGIVKSGRNKANAAAYLNYLKSKTAQDIYAKYGFVGASKSELMLKPIPGKKS